MRNWIFALLIVFSLIGGLLFVQGIRLLEEYGIRANLYFGGPYHLNLSTADGIILERWSVPEPSGPNQVYATYRYSVEVPGNGSVSYTDEDRIDAMYEGPMPSDALVKRPVGAHVSVTYVTDHPYISTISFSAPDRKDEYLIGRIAGHLLICFGIGALFLLSAVIIMSVLLVEYVYSRIKRSRLARAEK